MDIPGLQLIEARVPVSVAPSYGGHLRLAVEEQLNDMLMKYSPDLQGVLLSVARCRVPPAGVTVSVSPFVHLGAVVQGLVYRPQLQSVVPLAVDFVSEGHIGGLLLGVFPVAVPRDLLPPGSTYAEEGETWTLGGEGGTVSPGTSLPVRLVDMAVAEGNMSLLAAPAPASATASAEAEVEAEAAPAAAVGGSKRRREGGEGGEVEGDPTPKKSRGEGGGKGKGKKARKGRKGQ